MITGEGERKWRREKGRSLAVLFYLPVTPFECAARDVLFLTFPAHFRRFFPRRAVKGLSKFGLELVS